MSCMAAGILRQVLSSALTPRSAAGLPLGPAPAALVDTLPLMAQTSPPSTGTALATRTAGDTALAEKEAHLMLIMVGAACLLAIWQPAGHKQLGVEWSSWWATKGYFALAIKRPKRSSLPQQHCPDLACGQQ